MRERLPITSNATHADVILHIDQLHTCLDNTADKVDQALTKYEALAVTQQDDRHKARNRDMALLGGLGILIQKHGYEMEFDDDGALARMTPPAPRSIWDRLSPPATVIGTVIGALGAYKGAVVALGFVHHLLAGAHG